MAKPKSKRKPKAVRRTVKDCQGRPYSWKEKWTRHRETCSECGAFRGWSDWYDGSPDQRPEGFHRNTVEREERWSCPDCGKWWSRTKS